MEATSFAQLLYRYWFYGWLFRDASRGTLFERAAAHRHNQSRSRWLPTYLRRWMLLGLLSYGTGALVEAVALSPVALPFFVAVVLSASVSAVTLAAWIGLRVLPPA